MKEKQKKPKVKPKHIPETVLIVDADVIAFRSAAAAETRSVDVTHEPSGRTKRFSNRTEFKDLLKKKGTIDKLPEYTFKDIQETQGSSTACNIAANILEKIKQKIEPDRIELYVGGKDNFRNLLPLPSKYKGNREDNLLPVHLKEVKRFLVQKSAEIVNGIEVDDMVNIRAYEELSKGNIPIVCTNDKDQNQAEGVLVYNWTLEDAEVKKIPEIGSLELIKGKCKGSGLKFFAFQLLNGDPVDNFKPCEIAGVKFADTSAYNILKDLNTKEEILEAVVQKYKEWYPEIVTYTTWEGFEISTNWQGILELYWQCAYMHRKINDRTTWEEFFKERGWSEKD